MSPPRPPRRMLSMRAFSHHAQRLAPARQPPQSHTLSQTSPAMRRQTLLNRTPPASLGAAGPRRDAPRIPNSCWVWLDTVDLTAEFRVPLRMLQTLPAFLHQPAIQAFLLPLRTIARHAASHPQHERAWRLFLLLPRLLFHQAPTGPTVGPRALLQRV
jgi:hypothetical protein